MKAGGDEIEKPQREKPPTFLSAASAAGDAVLLWGWVPRWGQSLTDSIVSPNGCESP